ncbi:hypothetical protein AX774_g3231 [Zancudomyces culisetae]|uniref:Uncharacterized protein n=1 Tax=Zancudomyces culisetae TaxID=1213189 RepID=A0A1R1PQQ3_ZANCU|nr:hypothetical protein AX774_g3231 [Zancudomyces culisetae]|eukprot:OMH83261.1 hypothetical protein AX774_g3231 [Zancudomyces culisetae]
MDKPKRPKAFKKIKDDPIFDCGIGLNRPHTISNFQFSSNDDSLKYERKNKSRNSHGGSSKHKHRASSGVEFSSKILAPSPRKLCMLNFTGHILGSEQSSSTIRSSERSRESSPENSGKSEDDAARLELMDIVCNFRSFSRRLDLNTNPDALADTFTDTCSVTTEEVSGSSCSRSFRDFPLAHSPICRTGNTLPKNHGFRLYFDSGKSYERSFTNGARSGTPECLQPIGFDNPNGTSGNLGYSGNDLVF